MRYERIKSTLNSEFPESTVVRDGRDSTESTANGMSRKKHITYDLEKM